MINIFNILTSTTQNIDLVSAIISLLAGLGALLIGFKLLSDNNITNYKLFLDSHENIDIYVAKNLQPQFMAYSIACTSSAPPNSSTAITLGAMERTSIIIPFDFGQASKTSVRIPT